MTIASPTRFEEPKRSPSASAICSPSRLHLDLFSGIGGFAIAAQACGYQTIGFSEIEPYACKILKQNWPDVPNFGDIRNLRGVRADLVTGGFPCQPFSLAGKRLGAKDDRHLWPEMCRVIGEARPTWVLGENVPGIISMELDRVLSDLESLGYACWPLTIPACAVDARHRRDRLWVVAYSAQRQNDGRNGGSVDETAGRGESLNATSDARRENVAVTDRLNGRARTGRENGAQARNNGEMVSDANGGQHKASGSQRHIGDVENGNGESDGRACNWMPEPELGRVAHGIPNRSHRLRGLGNAIVPQVAEMLIGMMAKMENAPHELPHPGE